MIEKSRQAQKIRNDKGFTLLEPAIAMAIMALLTTTAIPYLIRKAETSAAKKTAKEISVLHEAAKWYYLNTLAWPGSLQTLRKAGLLGPSWVGRNPWGNEYSVSPSGTTLTVATTVPGTVSGTVLGALPGAASFGTGSDRTVASAISAPGYEAGLDQVRNAAVTALNFARESAVPPYGPLTVLSGRGWMAPCPADQIVIGTHAGGGTNVAGAYCRKIIRLGASNDAISSAQGKIDQLESEYPQLLQVNGALQVRYVRLIQEYEAFEEWWQDWRNY